MVRFRSLDSLVVVPNILRHAEALWFRDYEKCFQPGGLHSQIDE